MSELRIPCHIVSAPIEASIFTLGTQLILLIVTAFCFHPESCSSIKKIYNVVLIRPEDLISLEDGLFNIALGARHDILSMRHPHTDLATIWRAMGKIERIAAIKTTIFFVDDLDKLQDEEAIKVALPREAQNYSLRFQHKH